MKFKANAKLATLGLDNNWIGGPPRNFRFCWYYSGDLGTTCIVCFGPCGASFPKKYACMHAYTKMQ